LALCVTLSIAAPSEDETIAGADGVDPRQPAEILKKIKKIKKLLG
jgi:hypothetical protein